MCLGTEALEGGFCRTLIREIRRRPPMTTTGEITGDVVATRTKTGVVIQVVAAVREAGSPAVGRAASRSWDVQRCS